MVRWVKFGKCGLNTKAYHNVVGFIFVQGCDFGNDQGLAVAVTASGGFGLPAICTLYDFKKIRCLNVPDGSDVPACLPGLHTQMAQERRLLPNPWTIP